MRSLIKIHPALDQTQSILVILGVYFELTSSPQSPTSESGFCVGLNLLCNEAQVVDMTYFN